jgi:hypothetical protein
MNTLTKTLGVATVGLTLAMSMTTPSFAEGGRNAAAAIGFGAGVAIGAAAAGSYDRGYGYDRGYAYNDGYVDSGYGYADSGYGDYAYAPAPRYRYRTRSEWNTRSCTQSPGSVGYTPCNNQ